MRTERGEQSPKPLSIPAALVGLARPVTVSRALQQWPVPQGATGAPSRHALGAAAGFGDAQAFCPKVLLAFQQFHVERGQQEMCLIYSCPQRSCYPGSKWIRLFLLPCFTLIDSHRFAKYSLPS